MWFNFATLNATVICFLKLMVSERWLLTQKPQKRSSWICYPVTALILAQTSLVHYSLRVYNQHQSTIYIYILIIHILQKKHIPLLQYIFIYVWIYPTSSYSSFPANLRKRMVRFLGRLWQQCLKSWIQMSWLPQIWQNSVQPLILPFLILIGNKGYPMNFCCDRVSKTWSLKQHPWAASISIYQRKIHLQVVYFIIASMS